MLDLCSADNFTVGQSAAVQIWTFLQFGLMEGLAIFEEKMRLLWTQFLLTCSWPLIISTSNFQTFLIIEKNFSNQQNHSGDTVWKPWLQSIKKKKTCILNKTTFAVEVTIDYRLSWTIWNCHLLRLNKVVDYQ